MSKTTASNSSNGEVVTLTLIFVILKLCHVINWSWWWVLAPLWASLAVVGLILIVLFALIVVAIRK